MRKFTLEGREVEVLSETADGRYLVCGVYENEETEEEILDEDSPFVVKRLFDKPPTERLDRQISELQCRIDAMSAEYSALQKSKWDLERQEREHKERLERLAKQAPALERLEKFIAKGLTHYVMIEYSGLPKIVTAKEAEIDSEYDRPVRQPLLVLFGRSEGDLSWNLNKWSDGSGSWTKCIPCCSEQEAIEEARKAIDAAFKTASDWSLKETLEAARKFGCEVPESFKARAHEVTLKRLQDHKDKTQKEFLDADAALRVFLADNPGQPAPTPGATP